MEADGKKAARTVKFYAFRPEAPHWQRNGIRQGLTVPPPNEGGRLVGGGQTLFVKI